MTENKRVYCLYRVSTLGQVDKDDIPMQKQCCREFAEKQDWTIVKEFSEKGVSGFKTAAKDRMPFRRSSGMPLKVSSTSFWCSCLTVWADVMMRLPSW